MSKERDVVAYHEAGHAVADLLFDHAPDCVSIVPCQDRGTLGHECHLDGEDSTPEGCRRLAIACYAGAEAEKQYTGHPDGTGDEQDRTTADRYLVCCGGVGSGAETRGRRTDGHKLAVGGTHRNRIVGT